MAYNSLFLAYLVYFNRDRDYFECHEVLEELWNEERRDPLYKGLLQVAVGLYHLRNSNLRGGQIMLESAYRVLKGYPPVTLGIDLKRLVSELEEYLQRLEAAAGHAVKYYDLTIHIADPGLAEEMQLAAARIQPNIPQRRGPQRPASAPPRA